MAQWSLKGPLCNRCALSPASIHQLDTCHLSIRSFLFSRVFHEVIYQFRQSAVKGNTRCTAFIYLFIVTNGNCGANSTQTPELTDGDEERTRGTGNSSKCRVSYSFGCASVDCLLTDLLSSVRSKLHFVLVIDRASQVSPVENIQCYI